MGRDEFEIKLTELFDSILEKNRSKGKEYATNESVFINFDKGARVMGLPSELVLDGYLTKHYISYRDMLEQIKKGDYPSLELIDEKLGDIILYFILQKIMMESKFVF